MKENLPVSNWSITWDGADSALVQGKASFTVVDESGALAPWGWDEPLSAGGSRIQTVFRVGDESVDLGWWLITDNKPNESWRLAGPNLEWVPGGASIPVGAEELTRLAADYEYFAPESPPSGATVVSEVRRLLGEVCPVTVAAGVVDESVPSNLVYKDTRAAHVLDLVRSIGCWYRMTGDGALEIYSQAKTAPVAELRGGERANMVAVSRQQQRSDILNGVASTSNDSSLEIRRLATINEGALRYGGPVGWLTEEHTAIASTPEGVMQDAQTYLANKIYSKTLKLDITCLPDMRVQIGDWVRVAQPVINGKEYPLDGLVTKQTLSGSTAGFDPMKLVVDVSLEDAARVGLYVRRTAVPS